MITGKRGFCVNCSHIISNPVCYECYLKQIESWINEKKLPIKVKLEILKNLSLVFSFYGENVSNTNCVLCRFNEVNLCMYCLILETKKILEKNIKEEDILKNFEEIFDYKIWLH